MVERHGGRLRVRGAEELGVEARASISASQRGRVRGVWALRPWGELSRWPRSRTSISKWQGTFCTLLVFVFVIVGYMAWGKYLCIREDGVNVVVRHLCCVITFGVCLRETRRVDWR